MSLLVAKAKKQVEDCVLNAAKSAMEKGIMENAELGEFTVTVPQNREHGDWAVNAAMAWARAFHKAPRQIAEILGSEFDFSNTYIEKYEIAGPGFINFFLSDGYYADILADADEKGADYGKSNYGEGKRVLVEFVSANPTGPMHIGNARGGALGDCLASVLLKNPRKSAEKPSLNLHFLKIFRVCTMTLQNTVFITILGLRKAPYTKTARQRELSSF